MWSSSVTLMPRAMGIVSERTHTFSVHIHATWHMQKNEKDEEDEEGRRRKQSLWFIIQIGSKRVGEREREKMMYYAYWSNSIWNNLLLNELDIQRKRRKPATTKTTTKKWMEIFLFISFSSSAFWNGNGTDFYHAISFEFHQNVYFVYLFDVSVQADGHICVAVLRQCHNMHNTQCGHNIDEERTLWFVWTVASVCLCRIA